MLVGIGLRLFFLPYCSGFSGNQLAFMLAFFSFSLAIDVTYVRHFEYWFSFPFPFSPPKWNDIPDLVLRVYFFILIAMEF